jgi:hypothetical protein
MQSPKYIVISRLLDFDYIKHYAQTESGPEVQNTGLSGGESAIHAPRDGGSCPGWGK